jgi:hypothetical protein
MIRAEPSDLGDRKEPIWSKAARMPEPRLLVWVVAAEVRIQGGDERAARELQPKRLIGADPIERRAHTRSGRLSSIGARRL